jgi:hypothetical protein
MQIQTSLLTGTRDDHGTLLDCRMAMLGLDLSAIESNQGKGFDEVKRRCTNCGVRPECVADLKRDPNDPVWETYCPNAETLIGLARAWWLTH